MEFTNDVKLKEGTNYEIELGKHYKSKGVKLEGEISYKTFEINTFIDVVLVKRGSKELDLVVVFSEGVVDAMLESELVSGEDLNGILKTCYQLRNSLVVGNPLLVGVHVEVVEYRIMRALVKPGAKEIVDEFVGSLSEKINKK